MSFEKEIENEPAMAIREFAELLFVTRDVNDNLKHCFIFKYKKLQI